MSRVLNKCIYDATKSKQALIDLPSFPCSFLHRILLCYRKFKILTRQCLVHWNESRNGTVTLSDVSSMFGDVHHKWIIIPQFLFTIALEGRGITIPFLPISFPANQKLYVKAEFQPWICGGTNFFGFTMVSIPRKNPYKSMIHKRNLDFRFTSLRALERPKNEGDFAKRILGILEKATITSIT